MIDSPTERYEAGTGTRYAYQLSRGIGIHDMLDGAVVNNTLGSYTHLHPVASDGMFRHFVECSRARH